MSNVESEAGEFEEITYEGQDYLVDEEGYVFQMFKDEALTMGKLISRNPLKIDFEYDKSENSDSGEDDESDDESEEDEDDEEELYDIEFQGKTYTVDSDNDVFQENGGEYKYVGILISNEPVNINFFVDYHGTSYLINEKNGSVEDKETKAPIGKQLQKEPLKLIFYKQVDPIEPMVNISSKLSVDKKLDVYEGKKQIGYLIKVDNGLKKAIELKDGSIITLGSFQIV